MTRLATPSASDVDVLFVTTDPARDDRQVLRDYLDRFDPSFEGLTGTSVTDHRASAAKPRHLASRRASSCRPAATRSLTAPPCSGSTPMTRCRSCGPRAPRRPSSPPTSRHPPDGKVRLSARRLSDDARVHVLTSLEHPEPEPGRLAPRTVPAARLRPVHHPRDRRRRLDRRAPLGGPWRPAGRDRRHRGLGGALRPGRRPDLPRDHRLQLYFGAGSTRSTRCTSGRAGSASGAPSPSAASGGIGARRGDRLLLVARRASPPACWSRRPSAGGATTSTRSCSAARPTCRGRLEIDPAHRPDGYVDFATFHPTFLYECLWYLAASRRDLGRPAVPARPRPGVRALRHGYTVGRGWIEALRIDTSR